MTDESTKNKKLEVATLGGGCFWCLEAAYQQIRGVERVVSGYAGGDVADPTDREIYYGDTGHAEVVQVYFDPKMISYKDILDIFWIIHDPTTLNRQGNDVGPQYRSVIFTDNPEQQAVAVSSKHSIASLWLNPVVTEIVPLPKFYAAGAHHQNFYQRDPSQAYCRIIINPKLKKLREKFEARLK